MHHFYSRTTALAIALMAPALAMAESGVATGGAANSGGVGVSARLNLSITIPRFIALQVGSPNTAIDTVNFVLDDAQAATTGAITATSGSPVSVSLRSNFGNVNLAAAGGNLSDGGTNSIPLSSIAVAETGTLSHPAFGSTIPVTPNVGAAVINRSGTWAYTYNHNNAQASGTYTAQVTYTATAP